MKRIFSFLFLLISLSGYSETFFSEPKLSFLQNPTELIRDFAFSNTTVEEIHSAINEWRERRPNDQIRITLSGAITVSSTPLTLQNRMVLIFNHGTLQPSDVATSTSLLLINNAEFISIGGYQNGVIDGKGKNINGIRVVNSGKTHIDNLTIKNCKTSAIDYTGRGVSAYADAGSITRCRILNCSSIGVRCSNVFNFISSDNYVEESDYGFYLTAFDYSILLNNEISGCQIGISCSGEYDVISYNRINGCRLKGLEIKNGSTSTTAISEMFASRNRFSNNNIALSLNCSKARIGYNSFNSNTTVVSGDGNNDTHLISNSGMSINDAASVRCIYFNPPLLGNKHNELIKIGKQRRDMEFSGVSMQQIRSSLDQAHTNYPNTVIVAKLKGDFILSGLSDSLNIKEDECFLLEGTIRNESARTTAIYFNGNSTTLSSFSGGTIDGSSITDDGDINLRRALVFITGGNNLVIDSMRVVNGKVGQGIYKSVSGNPTYLRGCYIADIRKGRNVWTLGGANRLFAFENSSLRSYYDGIDIDAYSNKCVLLNNNCSENRRYGIFVEEGAQENIVMGNRCHQNAHGIALYNLEVANKFTARNLFAFNDCQSNIRGFNINASAEDRCTRDNSFFNNICKSNSDVGIGSLYNAKNTQNNYLALNSSFTNTVGEFYAKRDHTANTDWNLLYPSSVTASSTMDFSNGYFVSVDSFRNLQIERKIGISRTTQIEIINLLGQVVKRFFLSDEINTIPLNNLTTGNYFVSIKDNQNLHQIVKIILNQIN